MTAWVVATPFVVLVALYALFVLGTGPLSALSAPGRWNPYRLVEGADGRTSTSKAQWFLWTLVVIPCYAAIFVANWRRGDPDFSLSIPDNLLAAMGFTTATMAYAKGLTSAYNTSGRAVKKPKEAGNTGGLLTDDTGFPDLSKLQLMAWTLIAVAAFAIRVVHQLTGVIDGTLQHATLPDVDGALLVLIGIGQLGYAAKKATDTTPASLEVSPASQTVPPFTAGSATYTVTIGAGQGFSYPVALAVTDLPAGVSGLFSPNPATAEEATLTLIADGTTEAGTYPFTVQGTSGSVIRTAAATVVVGP